MITFQAKERAFKVLSVNSSTPIKGILLHVQRLKLVRKVLFMHFYEIEEEHILYKPNLNVFNHFPEDPQSKGLADVWLKINSLFEDLNQFQFDLRISKVYEATEPLNQIFNHLTKKNR